MVLLRGMSSTDVKQEINNKPSKDILEEDSEESYLSEEEISVKTFSDPEVKLKNVFVKKNGKPHKEKHEFCKVNVSVRYGRRNRFFNLNKKSQKIIQRKICKKNLMKEKICSETRMETPKKGKRCRAGGKAKGKAPEEESNEKCESDEESENYFFSRISLGFFQKFKDLSGASTSNQWEEEHKKRLLGNCKEKIHDKISEEMELLELQNWMMSKSDKLEEIEYLNPDTF